MCDVEYIWAVVQCMYARVFYSTICVTVRLTLKLALRHHEFGNETVDKKLTPR